MQLILQIVAGVVLLVIAAGLAIRLLHPLPPLEPRNPSTYLTDTGGTPLGRGATSARDGQPDDHSGVHPLDDGRQAFAARVLLARQAVKSLDIQYYIWNYDLSGTLLLKAVHDAAERGVRVRLLLDDNGIAGLDQVLAALDSHPNIEVRLFNPFVMRSPKMLGYLADFPRLNRRMHNKSFVADGQVAIIGGRNVGDEYFGARDAGLFADLDVLTIGPDVEEVSQQFDRYWASQSAYPAERILSAPPPDALADLRQRAAKLEQEPAARSYMDAIRAEPFIAQVIEGTLPFEWARVRMVSDDPAKGLGKASKDQLLATALANVIGSPTTELRLVSGYFVPTKAGVDALSALARRGVDVAVFTNAFESSDVWVVHAGYAERRKDLLRSGVRLFEMRGPERATGAKPDRKLIGAGSGLGSGSEGQVLRSSASMLHAKTFAVDGQRVFVGSFNFDPRSLHLNTELGFVIESPALAAKVEDAFKGPIPFQAYEVILTKEGKLNWIERTSNGETVRTEEPGTNFWQRQGISLLSRMPIEWLL